MPTQKFKNGTIVTDYDGWVAITLPNSYQFEALPQDNDEYRMRAYALGFSSAWEMCQYHDLTHAILADWLGLSCSPALLAAAGVIPSSEITDAEEHVVMALHRYINLLYHAGSKTTVRA